MYNNIHQEPNIEVPEDKYRNNLLDKWNEIGILYEGFTQNLVANQPDIDIINAFLTKCLRLWLELCPKAQTGQIAQRFNGFADMYADPLKALGTPRRILNLYKTLRDTLEELKITAFEREGGV